MKTILCVRLLNWPVDRILRKSVQPRRSQQSAVGSQQERAGSGQQAAGSKSLAEGRSYQEEYPKKDGRYSLPTSPLLPAARCPLPAYSLPTSLLLPAARCLRPAPSRPLLLTRTLASRQIVVGLCDRAKAAGVRRGMTLSQARSMAGEVQHQEHQPLKDAAGLEALARWMMRFTPVVALDTPLAVGGDGAVVKLTYSGRYYNRLQTVQHKVRPDELAVAEHGLFLDLTGCERVFHGLDNLLDQIRRAVAGFGLSAQIAVGPTPGAAWANTFGDSFDSIPVVGLRLTGEILHQLHHLGIRTLGQLLKVPRDSLPARFGPLLNLRLDQLQGKVYEPLTPLRFIAPISARIDFDGPVESLEAIWLTFKKLIEQITVDLTRQGKGARLMQVTFWRAYREQLTQTIRLSRPSRDPVNLFNLLQCALESLQTEDGFLSIELNVTLAEKISDQQIPLLAHEQYAGEGELLKLIERLRLRLGERTVLRAEPVQSHMPERAWQATEWINPSAKKPSRSPTQAKPLTDPAELYLPAHRPLRLLAPIEVKVMVSPSEDDDGRPIFFREGNILHPIRHAAGPERIGCEWWLGRRHTRDYYEIEDTSGQRFWLFRVRSTRKWYRQGEF